MIFPILINEVSPIFCYIEILLINNINLSYKIIILYILNFNFIIFDAIL